MKNVLTAVIFISALFMLRAENHVRAVSLAPALTETAAYLGCLPDLVGRSSACDYPPEVKKLPVTGSFGRPELEKILALKPDWVLVNDVMNVNILHKLRALDISVEQRQIRTVEDYIFWVDFMGRKFNCSQAAQTEIRRTRKLQQQLTNHLMPPLKVLWIVNLRPVIAAGCGSLPDQALKLLALQNAAADFSGEYIKVSAEWLLSTPFDLIIMPGSNIDLNRDRIWGKIPAVKKNRIIRHAANDPLTRPGPRWLPAIISLKKKIEFVIRNDHAKK